MNSTALLLIDLQVNMFDPAGPVKGTDALLARVSALLVQARATRVPIIFVRNCGAAGDPDVRGTAGWELHPALQPREGEMIFDKTSNDTFASTNLDAELKRRNISHVVIAGLQSEFCIRATVRGALAHGYTVTLVADGHSTFDGSSEPAEQISQGINRELGNQVALARAADIAFK